jgi:hypothetical protein
MKKFFILLIMGLTALITGTVNYFIINPIKKYRLSILIGFDEYLRAMPQDIRQVLNMYDEYGLKHNQEYLDSIQKFIRYEPLEKQAAFVDREVFELVNNNDDFLRRNLNFKIGEYPDIRYSNFSTTTVGNLAYIILHSQNADLVQYAQKILAAYNDYAYSKGVEKFRELLLTE